ncbi:MAG TPA: carboxypeptidase-like regulatory domain-containing protein [Thermoanaerobaculia bacterium]|nr:carboxypeptidase-like regulatory domain-containing protein [Thermoanaerobaculia bacterium]
MTTRRASVTLAVVLSALFGAACKEGKSPTEPAATVATPTPTPVPQPVSLSGVVRDQSGAPYGPALVACEIGSTYVSTEARMEPPGQYRITGLKPGGARVRVFVQGQVASQDFNVNLLPGDNTFDPRITVVRGEAASMSGFVRLASGSPAQGVYVWCQMKGARVAADGSYVLTGLYAGRWDVFLGDWYGQEGTNETVTLSPGANTVNFTIPN